MNATGELRRLLNERGVRWWPDMYYKDTNTCWRIDGFEWRASKRDDKLLIGGTYAKYLTPEEAVDVTVGRETCKEVYLLMATDIGDGREEVLGVYATESAAMEAINDNQFGYALHHVRKWEVVE